MTQTMTQPTKGLAVQEVTKDAIALKVKEMYEAGNIAFPKNYSPENALHSAWLILQEVKDKAGNLALNFCTKASISNALFRMVVLGLNPDKDQCYFIPYGNILTCQPSVWGDIAVAIDCGAKDVIAQIVYDGDEFDYEINRGKISITKHKQSFKNVSFDKIVGAYGILGKPDGTDEVIFMPMDRIRRSWGQSKMNPNGDNSTHTKFTDEMVLRTTLRRICKPFINSSNDSNLVRKQAYSESVAEITAEAEIAEVANTGELIGFKAEIIETPAEVINEQIGEVIAEQEAEPAAAATSKRAF